jgi:hypothetical protein
VLEVEVVEGAEVNFAMTSNELRLKMTYAVQAHDLTRVGDGLNWRRTVSVELACSRAPATTTVLESVGAYGIDVGLCAAWPVL